MSHETVAGAGTLSATYPRTNHFVPISALTSASALFIIETQILTNNTNYVPIKQIIATCFIKYFLKLLNYVMKLILNQMYAICDD